MTEQPGEGEPGALRLPRTPSRRFARRRLTPHRIPARPASPGSRPLRVRRAPPGAARAGMRPDRSSAVCGGERGIFPKSGEVSQEINRGYIRLYRRSLCGTHLDRANAICGGRRQYKNREKNVFKEGRLKKPEILRIDEDSAQGCFPNQAQVLRGEKWGDDPTRWRLWGKMEEFS